MIPIIPDKYYDELTSGISEAMFAKKFSTIEFRTFMRTQNDKSNDWSPGQFEEILAFLKETNVKYIASGSARMAFFMPHGCLTDKSAPCCLKISKSPSGCAQTKAEIKLFTNHKYDCFPKMFEFDQSGKYIITEVAKRLTYRSIRDYADEWNKKVLAINPHSKCLIDTSNDAVDGIIELVKQFNSKTSVELRYFLDDLYYNIHNTIIVPIAEQDEKYNSLKSLIEFSKNVGWNEVIPNDLAFVENWGVVTRNKISMPIPIDWGFTEEVYNQFYS